MAPLGNRRSEREIRPLKQLISFVMSTTNVTNLPAESTGKVFGGVIYECVRCGTRVSADELIQLPEIKCICGYRVLKKARPPVVKQVKAV